MNSSRRSLLDPQGLQAMARREQYGATKPGLSLDQVRGFDVPVPPLGEQRRIVAAIESYISRLDEAKAALERVRRNLKRYRAAVLQAAVEGRLVPTEADLARADGRDYEPASELLKRLLAERRRRWEEAELVRLKTAGKGPKDDRTTAPRPLPSCRQRPKRVLGSDRDGHYPRHGRGDRGASALGGRRAVQRRW